MNGALWATVTLRSPQDSAPEVPSTAAVLGEVGALGGPWPRGLSLMCFQTGDGEGWKALRGQGSAAQGAALLDSWGPGWGHPPWESRESGPGRKGKWQPPREPAALREAQGTRCHCESPRWFPSPSLRRTRWPMGGAAASGSRTLL